MMSQDENPNTAGDVDYEMSDEATSAERPERRRARRRHRRRRSRIQQQVSTILFFLLVAVFLFLALFVAPRIELQGLHH